ncbi:hypothetical protein [Salmonella phage PKM.Hi.22.6]|nr:hypothetical protein [Salmonella phage PKM.Hi.22.6]
MSVCEMMKSMSPYGEATLEEVIAQAKSQYIDWERMNFIQWNSAHGDIPREMVYHSHYIIIDGILVKCRHGSL